MTEHTTIGIDLGDTAHTFCVLDHEGNEMAIGTINNTAEDIIEQAASWPGAVIAMEACSHSPWISRLLLERGYTVYVGNPRKRCVSWCQNEAGQPRPQCRQGVRISSSQRHQHPRVRRQGAKKLVHPN